MMTLSAWNDLQTLISGCTKCDLSKTRTNSVFGEGNPRADIIFIGEAPGEQEDVHGRPFVGRAGKLLAEMLQGIGLDRKDVFICNIIKCRPPDNRDPRTEEIEACKDYLMAQIAFINPKVICTLGRHSMYTLIAPDLLISKVHGKPITHKNMLFLPIYHPAAALYRPETKKLLAEDFQNLKALLQKGI